MLQISSPAQFERFAAEVGEPAETLEIPPPREVDLDKLMGLHRVWNRDARATTCLTSTSSTADVRRRGSRVSSDPAVSHSRFGSARLCRCACVCCAR